jgi:thioredoxin reductase
MPLPVPGAAELLGQGLGYSITTHAHLLAGKRAAVLGATARALRGAAELARSAAQVYLIVPTITDMAALMARALADRANVEVLPGYRVAEVIGSASVEALVVTRDGAMRRLAVDAAFVDIGLVPNSSIVAALVETDGAGFIRVDQHTATSVPGIFAAGDVATTFGEQVLIAIGDGARAGLAAYDYLLAQVPAAAAGDD